MSWTLESVHLCHCSRLQALGCTYQILVFRLKISDCSFYIAGNMMQFSVCRCQEGIRLKVSGCMYHIVVVNLLQIAVFRLLVSGCRYHDTHIWLQVSGCRGLVAGIRLQFSGCWYQAGVFRLCASDYSSRLKYQVALCMNTPTNYV